MSSAGKLLTGRRTIAEWLDHPVGGPLLREWLAAGGFAVGSLEPVHRLPLQTMVQAGRLGQEVVDDLVRRVNGGEIPAEEEEPLASGIRFTGRTIIVTGAASGIGRATASRIMREGGRVVAVDIAADRLGSLSAGQAEGSVVPVGGDITNEDDIARIVTAAGDHIDGLANIAGITDSMMPLHELTDTLWQQVLAVNLDGAFRLSRAVLPAMLAAGSGSVVNVASEAALRGGAAGTAYTVSKHAVVGLTRSAAFLYGPKGVRTNAVAPGPVATAIDDAITSAFAQQRLGPFLRLIPPVAEADQLAATITWLLSDDSTNVNGAILACDGGWSVQ